MLQLPMKEWGKRIKIRENLIRRQAFADIR
jgi:hypothetical protein